MLLLFFIGINFALQRNCEFNNVENENGELKLGVKNKYSKINQKNVYLTENKTNMGNDYILQYSNLFGSNSGYSLASDSILDHAGNFIVVGHTNSSDFITLSAFDNTYNGGSTDAFIAKFSANGTLLWSTYFGGNNKDYCFAVIVDSSDNIIITGNTNSNNFPMFNSFYNTYNGGANDVFIAKFSSYGTIIWSNFLGGDLIDNGVTVAVDNFDNIIISGYTYSSDFPLLNFYDDTFNGISDVFITKFSINGEIVWSTFLGGQSYDSCLKIVVDNLNCIILTGATSSNNFPTLNAFNNTSNGYDDIFITKFNSTGTMLWSTYFGGTGSEFSRTITIDSSDNIFISGNTGSFNFPTLNANDISYNGGQDVFTAKFNNRGRLLWSTYLGGSNDDYCSDIVINSKDEIFIAGFSYSKDFIYNYSDYSDRGSNDFFLARYNFDGELQDITTYGEATNIFCLSIDYNLASDELVIVGYLEESNIFMDKEYTELTNGFNYVFVIILKFNPPKPDITIFQIIVDIILLVVIILLCLLLSFASYILINRMIYSNLFYNTFFLSIHKKAQTEFILGIIEEAKKKIYLQDHIIEENTPLWNVAKEYCDFERNKGLLVKKLSSNLIDKLVNDFPTFFESSDEKLLIALNKVILKRNGQEFITYLNSKIYNRLKRGSFKLKLPDHALMVMTWSIPTSSSSEHKINQLDIPITEEHHRLLGSLITKFESLNHLHFDFLPIIASAFSNLMSIGVNKDINRFYIEEVITPLSIEFKISLIESINKVVINNKIELIETILRTITITELVKLSEDRMKLIITKIARIGVNYYPIPFQNDDIVKISFDKKQNFVSIVSNYKIKVNSELLSKLLN